MSKLSAIRFAAAAVIAVSLYAFWLTLGYPRGAAMLPRALLVLLTACAASLLVRGPGPDGVGQTLGIQNRGRVLMGAAMCLGYVAAIYAAGYYAASALFVAALALVLRYRKRHFIAAAALGYPLAIYIVFEYLLKIPMPLPMWY